MIIDSKRYPFPKWDYLSYFKQVFNKFGMRALDKQFRFHIRRPFSRNLIKKYAHDGIGIEIGVGAQTIAPLKRTLLADFFSEHAQSRSLAQVFFSADEIPAPPETFSFVLSEHMLEHSANPIKVLTEWKRVLQPNGTLFLFLPHKERTFDRLRPRTTLDHLKNDFSNGIQDSDSTHLPEWMDLVINKGLAPHYKHLSPEKMASLGCLHHHVWLPEDIVEVLQFLNFEIQQVIDLVPDRNDSFAVIAKKSEKKR